MRLRFEFAESIFNAIQISGRCRDLLLARVIYSDFHSRKRKEEEKNGCLLVTWQFCYTMPDLLFAGS